MIKNVDIISQSEMIIKEHYALIYRYCFMKVFNSSEAQDIVQDVFFRYFQRFDHYKNELKTKEILFSIAHNLCVDYFRKKTNHKEMIFEDDFYHQQSKVEVERTLSMKSFIHQLDVDVRETIFLYYYYEFRIKDIAHIMNTSESNVKYRLKSGKDKLKQRFDKEGISYEEWFT